MIPAQLFHTQDKGKTCVSLIISFQHISTGKDAMALQVKKIIDKTRIMLEGMVPLKEKQKLINSLEKLTGDIKWECNVRGIGLYITPAGAGTLVQFPFEVRERIHIGESFWIRELLYLDYYTVDYYVLEISQKVIRLYKGKLNTLTEIHDCRFPYRIEKEERVMPDLSFAAIRRKKMFEEIDNKLTHYVGEYPLLIAGAEKQVLLFQEITNHWMHIVGHINGPLEENVWPKIKEWLDRRKEVVANEWLEKRALHKICGVRDIWRSAVEGHGKILLVERDYSLTAFQQKEDGSIHVKPPHTSIRIISDAVDEIMKIILDEKGEVIILENGALPAYQHMVLLAE